jgi:predicted nucleic acid-binding protein
MIDFIAVLDACVLFNASVRDTLLVQAENPAVYLPRWSEEILETTRRNLVKRRRIPEDKAARLVTTLQRAFPEACVSGFETLSGVMKNDPKDRHVLAAAVKCGAQTIVTFNVRDFPEEALEQWGIEAQHPDDFLTHQFHLAPELTIQKLHTQASRLTGWNIDDVLRHLCEFTPSFVGLVSSKTGT